jgi:hypothetical protein
LERVENTKAMMSMKVKEAKNLKEKIYADHKG